MKIQGFVQHAERKFKQFPSFADSTTVCYQRKQIIQFADFIKQKLSARGFGRIFIAVLKQQWYNFIATQSREVIL